MLAPLPPTERATAAVAVLSRLRSPVPCSPPKLAAASVPKLSARSRWNRKCCSAKPANWPRAACHPGTVCTPVKVFEPLSTSVPGPSLATLPAAADRLAGREDVGRALDVEAAVEGRPVHRVAVDRGQGGAGDLQDAAGEGDRGRGAAEVGVGRDAQLAGREDRAAEAVAAAEGQDARAGRGQGAAAGNRAGYRDGVALVVQRAQHAGGKRNHAGGVDGQGGGRPQGGGAEEGDRAGRVAQRGVAVDGEDTRRERCAAAEAVRTAKRGGAAGLAEGAAAGQDGRDGPLPRSRRRCR